jgi:hypothetical protein
LSYSPTLVLNEECPAPDLYLTTNLFCSVIHDADLNTICSLRLPRLNKANELSPGIYLFFRQERLHHF